MKELQSGRRREKHSPPDLRMRAPGSPSSRSALAQIRPGPPTVYAERTARHARHAPLLVSLGERSDG